MTDPDRPRPVAPEPFLAEAMLVEVDPAFSPDGRRIVTPPRAPEDEGTADLHATFLLNSGEELMRLAPTARP